MQCCKKCSAPARIIMMSGGIAYRSNVLCPSKRVTTDYLRIIPVKFVPNWPSGLGGYVTY